MKLSRENKNGWNGVLAVAGWIPWMVLVWLAVGCVGPRPLRGGRAVTTGPVAQSVVQGENASQASRQEQETVKVRSYTLPAGSRVEQAQVRAVAAGVRVTNVEAVVVSAPTPVVEREETRAKSELGAAQKDAARELSAKLASLRGIVWVGLGLFLLGLASLFYPPVQAVIGSVTTGAAMTLGGLALMILPTLVVGHELLILGAVAAAVGGWFVAHRHGELRGLVSAGENQKSEPSRIKTEGN
jgi:hypothetical protein